MKKFLSQIILISISFANVTIAYPSLVKNESINFHKSPEAYKIQTDGKTLFLVNNLKTVTFHRSDLININHVKYKYLKVDTTKSEIILAKYQFLKRSDTIRINYRDLQTFKDYQNFRFTNVINKSLLGAKYGCGVGFISGIAMANHLFSMDESVFFGLLFGTAGLIEGFVFGAAYGFISKGEGELNYFYKE